MLIESRVFYSNPVRAIIFLLLKVFFKVFCKLRLGLVFSLTLVLRFLRLGLSLVLDFGLRCVQIFMVRSVNSGLRSVNFHRT